MVVDGVSSDARLHVVTGKGGTGKTTVAAALAIALAAGGQRVLLMEVEGRQGIAQLFDVPPLPYEERRVAVAPHSGDVFALAVDPEEALREYLEMYYHLGRASKALRKIGAVEFATTVAPGVRDVLLTGKAYEAVRRRSGSHPSYDAVVLDAPPTGRITRFLNVNSEVAGLAKVGPIRRQADAIMGLLRSPQTAVHLVTLLEEMPTQETIDGITSLQAAGLPVGTIIVNQVRTPALRASALQAAAKGALDRNEVAAGIAAAGLQGHVGLVDALMLEASDHAERVRLERAERRRLRAIDQPMLELSWQPDGIDLS
ncbi:MAG: ArsA-related P-loop ATPase, partial [Candidatus Nanopelagicales bacterium]